MNTEINNKINPQKKRILFIITQSEFGGAQRFLYELITRLDRQKYEILAAAGREQKNDFLKSLTEKNINTKSLRFLKRETNPISDCLGIMELMKLINRFKPDYLHLNSSKAGVLGSIAGFKMKLLRPRRFKNLKIIYRIGGWSFNDPWPAWKKKLFILAEKMTAGFKNIIVVNNKNDYEQAVRLKIKPKKELKLIHNGIDALKVEFLSRDEARLKLFKNISKKYGRVFPAPEGRGSPKNIGRQTDFIIGTIANFYPTKGLEYLMEAVRFLKFNFGLNLENIKFLIIGDGKERKKLELLIKEYGLKEGVVLLGQIPEAFKYLKAFDVFVLPSVKEGFPWVILEAMAAKLPIVAANVGALSEIIENDKNGILIEPKNPQQLAEAIRSLMKNEKLRQEFGIQAHQTVLFKFPIEKMVRETEALFE